MSRNFISIIAESLETFIQEISFLKNFLPSSAKHSRHFFLSNANFDYRRTHKENSPETFIFEVLPPATSHPELFTLLLAEPIEDTQNPKQTLPSFARQTQNPINTISHYYIIESTTFISAHPNFSHSLLQTAFSPNRPNSRADVRLYDYNQFSDIGES